LNSAAPIRRQVRIVDERLEIRGSKHVNDETEREQGQKVRDGRE
jgi:hypothetical protein